MELVGITVSTNYDDLLKICIEQNYFFFTQWFIITDVNDFCTKELCSKYPNITVLDFNFFEKPSVCNCPVSNRQKIHNRSKFKYFNKGGGIKKAQEVAYKLYPAAVYLIIDSDICLPANFELCLKNITFQLDKSTTINNFEENQKPFFKNKIKQQPVMYGAPRILYDTIEDYKISKVSLNVETRKRKFLDCLGYFQLYKAKLYYSDSCTAALCDTDFQSLFKTNSFPLCLTHHIGPIRKNWNGRVI